MDIDGEKLRRARQKQFLTQTELAEKAELTLSTLSRLENGLQQARISTVRRLALALGIHPSELLQDDGGKVAA
jgi:transcriptional regulator with XRE-family HTH domain